MVLELPQLAQQSVPAAFHAVTRDYYDHTFSGIIFDIVARPRLPIQYLEIHGVSVRGQLGHMSVYWTPGGHDAKHSTPALWNRVHYQHHSGSNSKLTRLDFDHVVRVKPGERIGIYVHSTTTGDRAVVYGEKHDSVTHQDTFMILLPGIAHTSNIPFSHHGAWGMYGWRTPRQFVGTISYGINFLLWRPVRNLHQTFPTGFRQMVSSLIDKELQQSVSQLFGKAPKEIGEDEELEIIFDKLKKSFEVDEKEEQFAVGDLVRIPVKKAKFSKEGENFSRELYVVAKVNVRTLKLLNDDGNLLRKLWKKSEMLKVPKGSGEIVGTRNKSVNKKNVADRKARIDRTLRREGL